MTQRQLLIGFLALITLVVGGISAYVGIQLSRQDTAPTPSSAAVVQCGQITCADGREAGADCNYRFGSCRDRAVAFCGADNIREDAIDQGTQLYCSGETNNNGGNNNETPNCQVDNPSVANSYVQIGASCANSGTLEIHIQDAGSRSSSSECVGTNSLVNTRTIAPGERVAASSITSECGKCVQIDLVNYNGVNYGSAYFTGVCTSTPPTTSSFNCNDNNQCVAVNGSSGEYATRASCETACNPVVPSDDPVCGDTCDPNVSSSCPNDHTCSPDTNRCVLNTCFDNPAACDSSQCIVLGEEPVCGDTCNPNDASSCPNDHTCSEETNTCVLNSCLAGDAACDDNQCALLPETAFGLEDGNPYFVLALVMISTGTIFYLFRDVPYLQKLLVDLDYRTGMLKLTVSKKKKVQKSRESFEEKLARNN